MAKSKKILVFALLILVSAIFLVINANPNPHFPKKFFSRKTQLYLTDLSTQFLANKSLFEIKIDKNGKASFREQQESAFSNMATNLLKKTGFNWVQIDHNLGLVVFNYYHHRRWYRYFYSEKEINTPYDFSSNINMNDNFDWNELVKIFAVGRNYSDKGRENIVFEPNIIYDFIEDRLGKELISEAKGRNIITDDMKDKIISILNEQKNIKNKLIENNNITFEKAGNNYTLVFSKKRRVSSSFHVTRHINELLEKGILRIIDSEGHLKIGESLNKGEIKEVEWLHVEIMNIVYGNLFKKDLFVFDKRLSKNWYFTIDNFN